LGLTLYYKVVSIRLIFTVKFAAAWYFDLRENAMILPARSGVSALIVTLALWFGTSDLAIAACYTADQQLPAQTVNSFLANANQLL
jgi:hypothetical protein